MISRTHNRASGTSSSLQVCDVSSGSVRLAGKYVGTIENHNEEEALLETMVREEAIHDLFRRLCLITSKRRSNSKNESGDMGTTLLSNIKTHQP